MFTNRNARSLPIGEAIGKDVLFIPSRTVENSTQLSEFRRQRGYLYGSSPVVFSAPTYVGDSAVIFYRVFDSAGGFVQLVRKGGMWTVVTTRGWIE